MMNANRFFFVMLFVTAAGFAGIVGVFYWGSSLLEQKASTIANLQTERDLAQEKILALKKAQQGKDLIEPANALLNNLLPEEKRQETLVADVIYTAVAEAGISVNALTTLQFSGDGDPSDLSGTEAFKKIPGVFSYPFTMTVEDISYETLLVLLKEVENNGRLVQIDELQITPDKDSPGFISSVGLTMKAFLKP